MPSSGVRGTNTDDPTSVYAAQQVLDAFADEVTHAAGGVGTDSEPQMKGWCEVAIDARHDGLLLYWKGTPPAAVDEVFARAKADGITTTVIHTAYDRMELQPTVDALTSIMVKKPFVTTLSIENDCSAVRVGLHALDAGDEARVRALVPDPAVPLTFEKANVVAL